MKKLSIILIILLSVFCIECNRTEPCPSCLSDLNYFPYIKGQNLKFINYQNDTLIYTITDEQIYEDASATRSGKDNYCLSDALFKINSNQGTLNRCGINVQGSLNKAWSVHVHVRFNSKILEIELLEKSCTYKKLSKYLKDTIVIENEDNQLVKKVVIIKGKGLVSYTTADGEEWKLVE